MKIVNQQPPNIDILKTVFVITEHTIFTFGDVIFNPNGNEISPDLIAHEETHARQQTEIGIDKWWKLYIQSPIFRCSQEVEAYQNQYKALKHMYKDRNVLDFHLRRIAKDLSSDLYGSVMSFSEAKKAIKSDTPIRFNLSNLLR